MKITYHATRMDTFDLNGLDPQSAREVVLNVIRSLKETQSQRIKLEADLDLWERRKALAAERGRSDLQAEAQVRLDDIQYQLGGLRAEEAELVRTVDRLKQQLRTIENGPQPLVDTDQLLAELELLGGERDELSEKLREEEANALLEQLKRDMQDET